MSKKRLVIVGNGMVSYKFCEKLIAQGGLEKYSITIFGEEPRVAYDRVQLSAYFSGKTPSDLEMAPREWYSDNGIELYTSTKVVGIQPNSKVIELENGNTMSYDELVLATGSSAFVPNIPGVDKDNVLVYRTIEDVLDIEDMAKTAKSAAVIGGGLLGLEAAKALVDLGVESSHVIEFAPRLMPRQIDDAGSALLQSKIEELGVQIHLNKATSEFAGEDLCDSMKFNDGTSLDVDLVVISAGIRPRDELAKAAGITVGERGGIVVDNQLQTSVKDIYAIGEVALHQEMIYGLIAPGYQMADVLAKNLMGQCSAFEGADMSTKLKLMGVDVSSIGNPFAVGEEIIVSSQTTGIYKKLVLDRKSKVLLGAILVGDNSDYQKLYQKYLDQVAIESEPESLLVSGSVVEEEMSDTAQICSCENVTKGDLIQAIGEGCQDIASLKKCTGSGTGCGSCVPLMTDILNTELEKSGAVIDKSICQHFNYSRVELAEIVRTEKIKSYDELLGRYGSGLGCEICKPLVGSVLASYWNQHILNDDNYSLQDSNDRFLANIQKNGTYSVVPRVPGGEITPEQLIAIGEVAKEFDLYTKITGGQRIDLFGARLEQLPTIWEKLIAVGLESGHAYAKSLRTVKSCVGETWCRFGVGASVDMAVDIENRYKGLRAPHKIKMAVSGCARECAEAQSKDIGIIATENGWNLYVCGNGGMKPRHADLFAVDLDDATLIQYIDRVLMYYIRTADKLQRTAPWLEKLDGGLERLQDIVINDCLGIAEELEQEMAHQVDTYACEWKVALESPDVKKRFNAFVNTSEVDETIQFEKVRGQIRPNAAEVVNEVIL